jgi:hypothetical protein
MALLSDLDFDHLGPAKLWAALDPDTRALCARAMYGEDDQRRREANAAIAALMRFRPEFVRRLPLDKRVLYLARQVRADDGLAGSLLLAVHFEVRRALLSAFLDQLGIPHRDGVIDEGHELKSWSVEELAGPVAALYERFPAADVDLYLASLVALDRGSWGGLIELLRARTR